MDHNYLAAGAFTDYMSDLDHSENKRDVVQEWAMAWAEYFRLDETREESELQDVCNRLRVIAASIES